MAIPWGSNGGRLDRRAAGSAVAPGTSPDAILNTVRGGTTPEESDGAGARNPVAFRSIDVQHHPVAARIGGSLPDAGLATRRSPPGQAIRLGDDPGGARGGWERFEA
jgi:hypothetical protein